MDGRDFGRILGMKFVNNSNTLLVVGYPGHIWEITLHQGRFDLNQKACLLRELDIPIEEHVCFDISENGRRGTFAGRMGPVYVTDIIETSTATAKLIEVDGPIHDLAISGDGQFIAVGCATGTVVTYEASSMRVGPVVAQANSAAVVEFSRDNSSLFYADNKTFHIQALDNSGALARQIEFETGTDGVTSPVFMETASDGERVIILSDTTVYLIHMKREKVRRWKAPLKHGETLDVAAFTYNGKVLAALTSSGRLIWWKLPM